MLEIAQSVDLNAVLYEADTVFNSTETIDRLKAEAFPLYLIDWMMLGMGGQGVCRRVRMAVKDEYTYLIMVTTRAEQTDLVVGFEADGTSGSVRGAPGNQLF